MAKGADCKSAGLRLRRFDPTSPTIFPASELRPQLRLAIHFTFNHGRSHALYVCCVYGADRDRLLVLTSKLNRVSQFRWMFHHVKSYLPVTRHQMGFNRWSTFWPQHRQNGQEAPVTSDLHIQFLRLEIIRLEAFSMSPLTSLRGNTVRNWGPATTWGTMESSKQSCVVVSHTSNDPSPKLPNTPREGLSEIRASGFVSCFHLMRWEVRQTR